jgi:hypothetical protein
VILDVNKFDICILRGSYGLLEALLKTSLIDRCKSVYVVINLLVKASLYSKLFISLSKNGFNFTSEIFLKF